MTIAPFRTQGGTDTRDVVFQDSNTAISGAANAVNIVAGSSTWTFNAAGNLTIPSTDGSIVAQQDWTLASNTFGNLHINNANVVFDGTPGGYINTMQTDPSVDLAWFNQSVGDSDGSVYAAGQWSYDGWIPYMAKFDASGHLAWQRQLTLDGSEAFSGTVLSVAVGPGGIPLFVGRDVTTGDNGIWAQSVDPSNGDTLGITRIWDGEHDQIDATQIAFMPNGNVAIAGRIAGTYLNYEVGEGLAGSTNHYLHASTAPFGSNVPVTPNNWYIYNPSISNVTVNAINTFVSQSFFYVQPVRGGSIEFDGTAQFLYTNGAALPTGTGDFAIDCWFYGSNLTFLPPDPQPYTAQLLGGNATGALQVRLLSASNVSTTPTTIEVSARGGTAVSWTGTISVGDWHYLTVQRSVGVLNIYLDGGLAVSGAFADDLQAAGQLTICSNEIGGEEDYFPGQITNLRILQGVAPYGPSVTLPTVPLTAIPGTSILLDAMDQANAYVDSSANGYTVTGVGSPAWQTDGPYNGSGATADVLWDGTGGYTLSFNATGTGYVVDDVIGIPGTYIGGSFPANNLVYTITGVGGSGEISTGTITGTNAADGSSIWLYTSDNVDYSAPGPYVVRQSTQQNALLWTTAWVRESGTVEPDYFYSVCSDQDSNLYAGGYWYDAINDRSLIIKFDADGNQLWAVNIDPDPTNGGSVYGLAVDAAGDYLYVNHDDYDTGNPCMSKLSTADGSVVWTSSFSNISGSEGAVVAQDGNPMMLGTAGITGGPANFAMVALKLDAADGTVVFENALSTPGTNIYSWYENNPNNGGMVGTNKFTMAGLNFLYGGEGAMVATLPSDGSGLGSYGSYVYGSYDMGYAPVSVTSSPANVFTVSSSVLTEYPSWYNANPQSLPEHYQAVPGTGGNIHNIGSLVFSDGSVMTTAATGSGIGNLTVTGNVITVSPDTAVRFANSVIVDQTLAVAGVLTAVSNVVANSGMVWTDGSTPKVLQIWNAATNSLDTIFL